MRHARRSRTSNGRGVLNDLLETTRELVAGTLVDSVKEASRELLRRTLTVTLLYAVATALLGTGLILLLVGGFEALRLVLPDAVAYAIMGLLALGGGAGALRAAGTKNRS